MTSQILLLLTLLFAILDWIAVAKQWKKVEYLAKPGAMVFLLVWLFTQGGLSGPLVWFALGLGFSLIGDVLLMLPEQFFLYGLVSFLLAQLSYLAGFLYVRPALNLAALILFGLVALASIQLFRRIAASLADKGMTSLRLPVLIYTTAISLMLLSALLTLPGSVWKTTPALLVSGGALLFYISDGTLAWNRFVSPIKHGSLKVIITYHLGQIGIIVGIVQQCLGS